MNDYFFDKATAVDREQRIRDASEAQQMTAQYLQDTHSVNTTVIVPQYRRSFALSVMITVIGIFALFLIATPAGAQGFEPTTGGNDVYGDAYYIFIMGNVAYVRENYQESVDLFQESIDMIPTEIFETLPDFAHMYYFLGRSQLANGQKEDALESFMLYVEYSQGDALPAVMDYVEAHIQVVEIPES